MMVSQQGADLRSKIIYFRTTEIAREFLIQSNAFEDLFDLSLYLYGYYKSITDKNASINC